MSTENSNGKHVEVQDKMETDNGVEENNEQQHNKDNDSDDNNVEHQQQNDHEDNDDADNEDNGGSDAGTGNKRGRKPKAVVDPSSAITYGQFMAAQASQLRSLTKLFKQHANNGGGIVSLNGTTVGSASTTHTHANGQNIREFPLSRVEQLRQQSSREKKDVDDLSDYIIAPLNEQIYHPTVLTKGMNFGGKVALDVPIESFRAAIVKEYESVKARGSFDAMFRLTFVVRNF